MNWCLEGTLLFRTVQRFLLNVTLYASVFPLDIELSMLVCKWSSIVQHLVCARRYG